MSPPRSPSIPIPIRSPASGARSILLTATAIIASSCSTVRASTCGSGDRRGPAPDNSIQRAAGILTAWCSANDSLVYVCDRSGNRLQVFDRTGNLKRMMYVVPPGTSNGGASTADHSVSDVAFSPDREQRYIFVVYYGCGCDSPEGGRVYIVSRETGAILGQIRRARSEAWPVPVRALHHGRLEEQCLHRRKSDGPTNAAVCQGRGLTIRQHGASEGVMTRWT